MKTTIKLTIVLSLVFTTIIISFGTAVFYFLNNYSYIDFYKRLEARARIIVNFNLEADVASANKLILLKNKNLEKLENEQEYTIEIKPNISPKVLSDKYNVSLEFIKELLKTGKASGQFGTIFYAGSTFSKNNKQYIVIVSAENYYASHHLIFLRNTLVGIILLILLIVISLSIYFSVHFFEPIKEIIDKVKQISTENIHQRLGSNNSSYEINELVQTFNDLLNRIETAFETQKNFISNASHELGTPLTSIIGEADVSLLKERTVNEYQTSLKNILHQAERLDNITKSLLFLAQTGYKGKAIVFEMVRIDESIWETKALIDRLNPSNKIVIDLSLLPEDPKKLKIKGNKQLLQLAFANILNNACKYSNNNPVTVYIASSNSQIVVTIKDKGIGIPAAELAYIYDPFFRASNTKLFEGYGIGLPLARNVINLHKGSLFVKSETNMGTSVQIKLPLMIF